MIDRQVQNGAEKLTPHSIYIIVSTKTAYAEAQHKQLVLEPQHRCIEY
jgi:hypothetical protein